MTEEQGERLIEELILQNQFLFTGFSWLFGLLALLFILTAVIAITEIWRTVKQ